MLNHIILKNFLSFNEPTQLDFSNLRKAMIVGPNASGKSNVLKGMGIIYHLVLDDNYFYKNGRYNEFKPNVYSNLETSELACSLTINGNTYEIYFKVKLNHGIQILEEGIKKVDNSKKTTIYYSNTFDKTIIGNFSDVEKERLLTYNLSGTSLIATILTNQIMIADKKLMNSILEITTYFHENVVFGEYMDLGAPKKVNDSPAIKKEIIDFVKECDICLDDIHVYNESSKIQEQFLLEIEIDYENKRISEEEYKALVKRVKTIERFSFDTIEKNGRQLYYSTESQGTKNLIELLSLLFSKEDCIIFFDEIESSFHELLCIKILNLLNKQKRHQVIFTSHLIELMDNRWFNKSEIFVIHKNEFDSSNVIQLDQYKELRSDEKHSWKNWYRTHKISGYPKFKV